MTRCVLVSLTLWSLAVLPAAAQSRGDISLEGIGGYGVFVDESPLHHRVLGAAARVYVSRRISIGPEVVRMWGPGQDRDLFVTGNVMFDFRLHATGPGSTTPFAVAGAGLSRYSNSFPWAASSSTEGAVTGGGGIRFNLPHGLYVAAEGRWGWEPHLRLSGTIGRRW